MNRKFTPYIYILFFSFFLNKIHSQKNNEFTLEIKSKIAIENVDINSINYQKKFSTKNELQKTKDSVLNILKEKGYYTLIVDSIYQQKNNFTYFLKLGIKIKEIRINIKPANKTILTTLNLKHDNKFLILKAEALQPTLKSISNYLIKNGQLFSKVQLTNFNMKDATLFTELKIDQTKKRSINKTIIKGYTDFPLSFLKHYLDIEKQNAITKNNIEEISQKISQLKFASEIKKPELLFSKDSTLLYIYLKKRQSSSFDGLINFTSENKKLKFRGYLDLNLINIFNKGGEYSVNWKNNGDNIQDFTLKAKTPYIFNSKISSDLSFNLFRNDSVYTNSNSKISLKYPINKSTNISLIYNSENSSSNSNLNNIETYNKNMFGFGINYQSQKKHQFNVDFNISYGTRNTNIKVQQYLTSIKTSRLINLSEKTIFYINNKSSFLFSDNYLENELFREGGTNSIRGFQEQSIFASKFSYINSEFRFLSKNKSYLYSIHDFGVFKTTIKNLSLYTFGFGYNYLKGNNSININYTFGNSTNTSKLINSPILSIKYLTLF